VDPRIFRGFVRPASSTTVSAYNTSNSPLGTAFTHACGTVQIIRTMKLPDSNNQIIAIGGNNGRRVLHFNTTTNVYTSIFNSTAVTSITGCDITYNVTNNKFYVAWCRSSTTNTVTLTTGTLSSPTTAMTDLGALTGPGANSFTCVWTPDGNTLAVRTGNTIRTYYRDAGDVMILNGTTYSLSGGLSGTAYEDISWNALGTVLAAGRDTRTVTRYTLGSNGALTSLGDTIVPSNTNAERAIPAFNPNPLYANVMAVGMDGINGSIGGFTFAYFASGGSGALNASPGATGYLLASDNPRQIRWSPTGDRLMFVYTTSTNGFRYSPFTYAEGSTALVATGNSWTGLTIPAYGFDWIYY
jgi:hypothetical protein